MSSKELRETIQAMVEEGNLPDEEMMEEVLMEREQIDRAESTYT